MRTARAEYLASYPIPASHLERARELISEERTRTKNWGTTKSFKTLLLDNMPEVESEEMAAILYTLCPSPHFFCHHPERCAGLGCCQLEYACDD